MDRNILAALLLLVPSLAFAQQVGAPATLVNEQGLPVGTATNPLQTKQAAGSAGTSATTPAYSAPYSGSAGACAATTVATTATQILAANGPRNGGGFKVPSGAAQGVYYSWNSATPGTTEGGTTFYAAPGSSVSFAGAPSNALYAQAAASTVIACFAE